MEAARKRQALKAGGRKSRHFNRL